jgi:hypothetical protein
MQNGRGSCNPTPVPEGNNHECDGDCNGPEIAKRARETEIVIGRVEEGRAEDCLQEGVSTRTWNLSILSSLQGRGAIWEKDARTAIAVAGRKKRVSIEIVVMELLSLCAILASRCCTRLNDCAGGASRSVQSVNRLLGSSE